MVHIVLLHNKLCADVMAGHRQITKVVEQRTHCMTKDISRVSAT